MIDDADASGGPSGGGEMPFRYHLELTPPQLKITHTALHSLLNDFGHDESEVHRVIHEILGKLPDEHAIRAIRLGEEGEAVDAILDASPASEAEPSSPDEPPAPAA
jgi:hypothetical protein